MADTTVRSNRARQQHHETVEVATRRTRAYLTSSPRDARVLLRPPMRTLFKSVTDGAETKTGLKEQTYG